MACKIEFIEGETYVSSYDGMYNNAEFTPIYAMLNGKQCFVRNSVNVFNVPHYGWYEYEKNKNKQEVERVKNSLVEHDGKYITFHALYDNPFEFLDWIKREGYTLEVVSEFFLKASKGNFTDFHGNSCEYSCSFHYRIYDEEMLKQLEEIVAGMKQHIR